MLTFYFEFTIICLTFKLENDTFNLYNTWIRICCVLKVGTGCNSNLPWVLKPIKSTANRLSVHRIEQKRNTKTIYHLPFVLGIISLFLDPSHKGIGAVSVQRCRLTITGTGLTHAKLVSALTSPCCSGWPAPMNTPQGQQRELSSDGYTDFNAWLESDTALIIDFNSTHE